MCWVFGHEWFWLGRDTACRDVRQCAACGVVQSVSVASVITTSTIRS